MLDLDLLPDGGMSWLDASGPESSVVLSSRVRLARNLQGIAFTTRADDGELEATRDQIIGAARQAAVLEGAAEFRLDGLEPLERQLLHERHMISRDLAGLERGRTVRRGAALLTNGELGMMINEEDHLRLQSLRSGSDLTGAYAVLERLDTDLGRHLPLAFHPEFGYLTACPTNVGTGLRASVLIHLPGLVLTKRSRGPSRGSLRSGSRSAGSTARAARSSATSSSSPTRRPSASPRRNSWTT